MLPRRFRFRRPLLAGRSFCCSSSSLPVSSSPAELTGAKIYFPRGSSPVKSLAIPSGIQFRVAFACEHCCRDGIEVLRQSAPRSPATLLPVQSCFTLGSFLSAGEPKEHFAFFVCVFFFIQYFYSKLSRRPRQIRFDFLLNRSCI